METSEIIKAIKNNVDYKFKHDAKLMDLYNLLRTGDGNYKQLYKYEEQIADAISLAIGEVITEEVLTDELAGRIGTDVIGKLLNIRHTELINIAKGIEKAKLNRINIGFNPVDIGPNETRVRDIVNKYNAVKSVDELQSLTESKAIQQFLGASLDEFCEANASFQYEAGLSVVIVRQITGKETCAFCRNLAGIYEYDGTPECGTGTNLFSRHMGCDCTIDVRTKRGNNFERVNNYRRR